MHWHLLKTFYYVAQMGSLQRAEKVLCLSHSVLSRHILQLEQLFQCRLFDRGGRSYGLRVTEAGRQVFSLAQMMMDRVAATALHLIEQEGALDGSLFVLLQRGLGAFWLNPLLFKFHKIYPQIRASALTAQGKDVPHCCETDLIMHLTYAPPRDGTEIICKPLGSYELLAYASKEYLAAHDIPRTAHDLDQHLFIGYCRSALPAGLDDKKINYFLFAGQDTLCCRRSAIWVDNIAHMLTAVEAGAGIGLLPEVLGKDNGNLVRIPLEKDLPSCPPVIKEYLVYPTAYKNYKKVQVFLQFISDEMKNQPLSSAPMLP